MNKKTVGTAIKYALALALMAYVVWSNWGDPRGTAGKIVVGGLPGKGKVTGEVVSFIPDESITVREENGRLSEFALKKNGQCKIVGPDDAERPVEAVTPGVVVSVADISRGLAFVWRQHVVEGHPIHSGYLLLAFVVGFLALMITFLRWFVLVRAVDLPFRLVDALRLGFIGFFFNTFMPGSVGGDAIKAWFLAREQNRRTVAVATVIMDRAIALWALVWFVALLGGAFWLIGLLEGGGAEQSRRIVISAWVIVAGSMLVWALMGLLTATRAERFAGRLQQLPKVGVAAAEFWRAVWTYRCRPRAVFGVLALSWVGHVGFVLLFFFSVLALWDAGSGQEIPTLTQHFLIVPIGLVINAMPLFPGGAGIGELGFGKLYEWLGCSEANGVLGSLVQRVISWVIGVLGYFVYRRMRATLPIENARPTELAAAEV